MKNYFKILTFFFLCLSVKVSYAQSPCSLALYANPGINGNVSFQTYATTTLSPNSYTWNYGNGTILAGTTSVSTAMNYTANGNYVVTVTYSNAVSSCSASSTQTVQVNNANGCNLIGNFGTQNNPSVPGLVNFVSNVGYTVSGTTYTWSYGDGTPNGTGYSTNHTYANPGQNYTVALLVNNNTSPSCTYSVQNVVMVCGFVASVTASTNLNGAMSFTGSATGSTASVSYFWNFGNNNYVNGSTATYTYLANGNYSVNLTAASGQCSSTALYVASVSNVVAPCGLNAQFYSYPGANGTINFVNQSTNTSGGVSYLWDFGDNSTSTNVAPVHSYSANGVYNATLTANNNYSYSCLSVVQQGVFVNSVCNLAANFVSTIGANGNVTFANTSTGTTGGTMNYVWDFGDNSTASTLNSPSHVYANGAYTVTLEASKITGTAVSTCTNSVLQVITVTTCVADGSFSMTPTPVAQVWTAYPLAPSNVIAASWNWGDNSSSDTLYTTHTYSAAGLYSICLTVTVSCGSINTYCMPYAIFKTTGTSQSMEIIQVTVVDPATITGIKKSESANTGLNIFPNPNNGLFNLNFKGSTSGITNIQVYDVIGKMVYEKNVEANKDSMAKEINLDHISNGVYFVKVNTTGNNFTQKIIVSK